MKKWMFVFVILAITILPGLIHAEDEKEAESSSITLEEVVVTGTRYEQRVERIPAHVAIITAEQIKASQAQSVPDVLRSLGGVFVTDLNGNGNNQMVDMGGFGGAADRHVAVLIDGRRINSIDQSGIRWTAIPVENIERIEILHGSGSVLYGDNAVGGVINIITKDWDRETNVSSELAIGTHDTRKGHVRIGFGKGDVGMNLGFTRYQTDGYRERSETDRNHFYSKIRCDASDNMSLFCEFNISQAEYQFPGAITEDQRDENREQAGNLNDEGKDDDASVAFGFEADWGEKGLWNLTISHRDEDRDSDMVSWWSYMKFDVKTDGLTSQYILEKSMIGHDNRLTLGLDIYKTGYEAYGGLFKGATTNQFDHSKRTFSGYIQDEYNLLDSLLLNMGVRYEDPTIKLGANIAGNETKEEFDESEWAWNLGLAYSFMPESKVYGRVYRSFRYPVVDEYTSMFTGAMNDSLKQETVQGYEAGVRLFLFSKLVFNLRVYCLDVDDEIAWNSATNQNENLDETRHSGGEFDFRFQPVHYLALYGGAGYTNAEFTEGENDGKSIPLVPEWKGNAGLELNPGFGLKGRLQYNFVGEKYFDNDPANNQKRMEDYHTIDLYLTYKYRMMEIFFNATNIFNEKYSDYGWYSAQTFNYYPMPEAIYFGGVRITF